MLTDHVQFCNCNRFSIAMYLICGIHFISVTCLLLGVTIFTKSRPSVHYYDVGPTNLFTYPHKMGTFSEFI